MTCYCTIFFQTGFFSMLKKERKEIVDRNHFHQKSNCCGFRDSITMIWLEKQIVLLLGPKGVIKPRKIISKEQNHLFFQNYLSCSLSYGCKLHKSNFMHNLEHSISIFIKMDFANFTCANTCIKVYCRIL